MLVKQTAPAAKAATASAAIKMFAFGMKEVVLLMAGVITFLIIHNRKKMKAEYDFNNVAELLQLRYYRFLL